VGPGETIILLFVILIILYFLYPLTAKFIYVICYIIYNVNEVMTLAVVVIEGPDNVGKTVVAKYLANKLQYKYMHFSAPKDPETVKDEYLHTIDTYDNVIYDRSWIGEFVYAPLFRGYEPDYFDEIERAIRQQDKKFLFILLYADEETARQFPADDKDLKLLKYTNIVAEKFVNVFNKIKSGEKYIFNVAHFKTLEQKLTTIYRFVVDWLRNVFPIPAFTNDYRYTVFDPGFRFINGTMSIPVCNKCPLFADHIKYDYGRKYCMPTWGVGNLEAEIIFVGEAPGWKGCGRTGIPFYNDKSGTLFRNALFWNRILETEIYITNVVKCNPKNNKFPGDWVIHECLPLLKYELSHLKNAKYFVALGKTAARGLYLLGKKPIILRHPAYFLYKNNIYGFLDELKKVVEVAKCSQTLKF